MIRGLVAGSGCTFPAAGHGPQIRRRAGPFWQRNRARGVCVKPGDYPTRGQGTRGREAIGRACAHPVSLERPAPRESPPLPSRGPVLLARRLQGCGWATTPGACGAVPGPLGAPSPCGLATLAAASARQAPRQVNGALLRISGTPLPHRRSRVFASVYRLPGGVFTCRRGHGSSLAASSLLGLGRLGGPCGRRLIRLRYARLRDRTRVERRPYRSG